MRLLLAGDFWDRVTAWDPSKAATLTPRPEMEKIRAMLDG
jgi:hypothetical protein